MRPGDCILYGIRLSTGRISMVEDSGMEEDGYDSIQLLVDEGGNAALT